MAMGFERSQGLWIVMMSFFAAFVFSIVSLPDFIPDLLGYLRPDWVLLVLIYWVIALPQRVGLMTAWTCGFLVDVMLGGLLGQHSLPFVLVIYLVVNQYQRIRMFSVWQQSLVIFALVLLNQLISLWVDSIVRDTGFSVWYFMPSVATALLWPWVFLLLRSIRRRFGVG